MWSKKRISVSYTPRKLRRPSVCLKKRLSVLDKNSSNIKVVVRVRPPNERDQANRQVVQVIDERYLIFDPKEREEERYVGGYKQLNRDMLKRRFKNMEFEFDQVFDSSKDNQEVFEKTTQDLIAPLLEGFNCSVFVYGATGAGKTYTMLGSKETPGIAYLTMVELYQKMEEIKEDYKFDVKISYLEVYNETVKDLINPSGPLNIRDDGKDGIIIPGIKTHHIASADELFHMLEYGNKNRTQHPTDSNAESSRSHAVFQVHLCITNKLSMEAKISKLTMIDLAGSERGAATGGKGIRFSEGSNINKSLLALGNCVDALAEGHKHVPYRNSKLTRILKDSLGGNSKTVMIVNVTPSCISYEETFNTLNYAMRAKKISNKAHKNLLSMDMSACQYKKIIEDLKQRNAILENEVKALRESGKQIDQNREEIGTKNNADVQRGKDVLKILYELEAKYKKELLTYQMKTKSVDWRIYQKQIKSERFQLFYYILGDFKSQVRIDESMKKLKSQRKVYKEKLKMVQKLIKEKQALREIALKDIESKGLINELKKDVEHYAAQMAEENMVGQINYYKELLLKQQHEMTNNDRLISRLCKSMDYFYSVLNGLGRITEQMSKDYLGLVEQLAGVKSVSWEDDPTEYTLLRKVMDLSYISHDSSPENPVSNEPKEFNNDCFESPKQELVPASLHQYSFFPSPGPSSSCTPLRPPVVRHVNERQFTDIPEEEELVVPPDSPLTVKVDFNKTFTVPCIQENVDTCSPKIFSEGENVNSPLNVTFKANEIFSDTEQCSSEKNDVEKSKDVLCSIFPAKPAPKVSLPIGNTSMKKGLISDRKNCPNAVTNFKYEGKSSKFSTSQPSSKAQLQSSSRQNTATGARFLVRFNVLSEKNKLPLAPLKGPVNKAIINDKPSKIPSPSECAQKQHQKENNATSVKQVAPKISLQDNSCKGTFIRPRIVPIKRTADYHMQRFVTPTGKNILPR